MRPTPRHLLVVASTFIVSSCADGPTNPRFSLNPADASNQAKAGSKAGTTLSATKTATGFNETHREYDWTLEKHVKEIMDEKPGRGMYALPSTSEVEIPKGEARWIEYEIIATRNQGTTIRATGVRGEVCVTNGGSVATEGLQILDVIQTKSGGSNYQDLKSQAIPVAQKAVLVAGESYCYPYEITFTGTPGSQYRNTARVTITNHSGHLGSPFGPAANGDGVKADFSMPTHASEIAAVDADAVIHENIGANDQSSSIAPCSQIFYHYWCSTGSPNEWQLTASGSVTYILDLYNFFGCGDSFDFVNTATLTEGGTSPTASGRQTTATSSLHVTSPACDTHEGCTHSVPYWKDLNHSWPDQTSGYKVLTGWNWTIRTMNAYFDSGRSWQQVLDGNAGANAYSTLAQNYIAATLNDASGAQMPASVRSAYTAAARYFSLSPAQRATVENSTLSAWNSVLAAYNTGGAGVPRCVEE